ncbi:MAG: dihydrofolate reductase [Bacteroidota bacterium]
MKIILIAAMNSKRVIGKNGAIPWHISDDLQRFKQMTIHHTVLMGRKTFESIGKPLPQRKNVVITKQPFIADDVVTFPSLDAAFSALMNEEKIYVIGGGEIFQQTIDLADELMLTIVDDDTSGDTFFPQYEHLLRKKFVLFSTEDHKGFRFRDYRKI